jgi:hypothetical protein
LDLFRFVLPEACAIWVQFWQLHVFATIFFCHNSVFGFFGSGLASLGFRVSDLGFPASPAILDLPSSVPP